MFLSVHPAVTMMRGDGKGYNPRDLEFLTGAGGREMIQGVFRDDGGVGSAPRRPDVPFHVVLPPGFGAWHSLNTRIFYALTEGQTQVFIDMCFQ
jgi:hypothetical protein